MMAKHPGLGLTNGRWWRQALYYEDVYQHLAPLARALEDENRKLKLQLEAVNMAAHTLASKLCGVPDVMERKEVTLIDRDDVMDLVASWRTQWDAAMKLEARALVDEVEGKS